MKNRLWLIGLEVIGLAIVAPVGWYLASLLLINIEYFDGKVS